MGKSHLLLHVQEFQELHVWEEAELHDSLAVELVLALVVQHVQHGELGVEAGQDQRQDHAGSFPGTGTEGKKNWELLVKFMGMFPNLPSPPWERGFPGVLWVFLSSKVTVGWWWPQVDPRGSGAPGDLWEILQEKLGAPRYLQGIH